MATDGYREIERARATRFETLELVDGLGRDALDFSTDDAWSLGEILDHLVKVDRVYLKNIDRLVARKKAGKMPFMYRGFADMVSLPKPLRKVAPLFELPMTLSNSLLPSAIRQSISANRSIPLKAPGILKPEKHRDGAALREDLRRLIDELDRLESKSFDLRKLYYYNPILGLVTVPGAVEFLAGHEKRHQGQIRDLLSNPELPRAEA